MADVFVVVNPIEPAVRVVVNPPTEPDVKIIVTSDNISEVTSTVFSNDTFDGDGNTSVFTLTYDPIYIVYVDINGLIQLEADYTSVGKDVTLNFTPINGDKINIEYTK